MTKVIVIGILSVLVIVSIVLLPQYFEARTFNKFQPDGQPKASIWDAMWADLRVMNNQPTDKHSERR